MRSFGLKRVLCAAAIALGLGVFATCDFASAVSGTVTLEGQKVVTGGSVSAGEFSFELRKPNSDDVIMTTTNDDEGNIVFENVPYTDSDILNDKYIIYEVREVQGDDDSIVYDNNVGYATVELNEAGASDSDIVTIFYAKPVSMEIRYDGLEYNVFHATDDELQGVAYSKFDSRDGSLVFFRDEEGAFEVNKYIYFEGSSDYLYYTVVPEEGPGFNSGTAYANRDRVRRVKFEDAVRPESISFEYFGHCESYDLRKLDTSKLTSMKHMFAYGRDGNNAKTINVSSFDTSNVTDMSEMFYLDGSLERVIWGDPNTSKVTDMSRMMKGTLLESFDFSAFETDALTSAESMFSRSSSEPIKLSRIDMSSWKKNGVYNSETHRKEKIYDTQTMFMAYLGDYLDISNYEVVYSAEFSTLYNVKVAKLCIGKDASNASPVVSTRFPMINIETGEVLDSSSGYLREDACGTYAVLGNDGMTFVNRKKAKVEVKKIDDTGEFVEGASMALEMDGAVVYSWDTTNEAQVFDDLAFGHDYELIEYEAPDGYKAAEPVEFSVSTDGIVSMDGTEVSSIEIVDELNAAKVKKVWDDEGKEQYRPESVSFELLNAETGEILDTLTLTSADADANGAWVGIFEDYDELGINPEEVVLMIAEEDELENYLASYMLYGSEESSDEPIAGDKVIVTNTSTIIDEPETPEEEDNPETPEEAENPETGERVTIGGRVMIVAFCGMVAVLACAIVVGCARRRA